MTSPLPPPPQAPSEAQKNIIRAAYDRCYSSGSVDKFAQLIADHVAQQTEALTAERDRLKGDCSTLANNWSVTNSRAEVAEKECETLRAENARLTAERDQWQHEANETANRLLALHKESGSLRAQLQESAERERGLREAMKGLMKKAGRFRQVSTWDEQTCRFEAHAKALEEYNRAIDTCGSALTAHPPQTAGEKET